VGGSSEGLGHIPPALPCFCFKRVAGKGTGYRYFGAAKQLPGVKELFETEAPKLVLGRVGR
jgi:hypothetical protein